MAKAKDLGGFIVASWQLQQYSVDELGEFIFDKIREQLRYMPNFEEEKIEIVVKIFKWEEEEA